MDNTTKTDAMTEALAVLSEAIAERVTKNLNDTINLKISRAIEDYMDNGDFLYSLEDTIKEKMSDIIDDHVSNVSLRIEVD
jgi:hypothetical protein